MRPELRPGLRPAPQGRSAYAVGFTARPGPDATFVRRHRSAWPRRPSRLNSLDKRLPSTTTAGRRLPLRTVGRVNTPRSASPSSMAWTRPSSSAGSAPSRARWRRGPVSTRGRTAPGGRPATCPSCEPVRQEPGPSESKRATGRAAEPRSCAGCLTARARSRSSTRDSRSCPSTRTASWSLCSNPPDLPPSRRSRPR